MVDEIYEKLNISSELRECLEQSIFKNSLYFNFNDFYSRSYTRRLTFGYSAYSKNRIRIKSLLRLIWVAYFTKLGGRMRHDAYVCSYVDRIRQQGTQRLNKAKVITVTKEDELKYSVMLEKKILDEFYADSPKSFLN